MFLAEAQSKTRRSYLETRYSTGSIVCFFVLFFKKGVFNYQATKNSTLFPTFEPFHSDMQYIRTVRSLVGRSRLSPGQLTKGLHDLIKLFQNVFSSVLTASSLTKFLNHQTCHAANSNTSISPGQVFNVFNVHTQAIV